MNSTSKEIFYFFKTILNGIKEYFNNIEITISENTKLTIIAITITIIAITVLFAVYKYTPKKIEKEIKMILK